MNDRIHNTVNEITGISESVGQSWPDPVYDAVGNTTSMPRIGSLTNSNTAKYDAWNRMMEVKAGSDFVGKYEYDGRGRRIIKKSYVGGTLDETRDFYYTNSWQDIEEQVSAATDVTYVWGIRYVDEMICRTNGATTRWVTQDANFNVTGLIDSGGAAVERYVYAPYGSRAIYSGSWVLQGSSGYNWVYSHQGLMRDVETGLIYNRMRYLHFNLGRFLQRDLLGYINGMSLYECSRSSPIRYVDPSGLDIFVYPSKQVSSAGDVVAKAFQDIIGDCATIYAEPTYIWRWHRQPGPVAAGLPLTIDTFWVDMQAEVKYWTIKYKNEKPKCKCNKCWKQLKEAIDEVNNIHIYLDTNDDIGPVIVGGGGRMQHTEAIYNPIREAKLTVDYSYLTQTPVTVPGEYEQQVENPFEIVLWHEAIGHGLRYIDHQGDATHLVKQGANDPVIKDENEARNCWNLNHPNHPLGERAHKFWSPYPFPGSSPPQQPPAGLPKGG